MSTNEETLKLFEKEMSRLEYSASAIDNYIRTAKQLAKFTQDKPFKEIDFAKICEFFNFLETRRGYKPKTVNLAIYSLVLLYNSVLKIDYNFDSIQREKPQAIDIPSPLSKEEVVKIINAVDGFKSRTIIALIYSSGLKVNHVINIRLTDIDFHRKRIRIYSSEKREAVYTPVLHKFRT
jgi:site-specific recombinase XerD